MGLVGRLFGLGLVVAGLFIAVYWTLWTLMIVVSTCSCAMAYIMIHDADSHMI